jgi:hypothetical protein
VGGVRSGVVQRPPAHAWPLPQAVPSGFAPDSVQVGAAHGEEQAVTATAHALASSQERPVMQAAVHAPPAQTRPFPQAVPSGWLPLTWHVPGAVAELHAIEPVLHGSDGSHAAPALHELAETHDPPLQTSPAPQLVASGLFSVTTQPGAAAALVHVEMPVVHGFSGWQTWFPTQDTTHAPALQTFPPPQAVPSGTLPLSTQADAPPAQLVRPRRHGSASAQLAPSTQVEVPLIGSPPVLLPPPHAATSTAHASACSEERDLIGVPPDQRTR